MVTEMIYEQLKEQDNTLSRSRFSREYLGRDRNYWFVCKNRGLDISDSVLLNLYGTLLGTSKLWDRCANSSSVKGNSVYRENGNFNKQLADIVLEEIERRAFA